MGRIPSDKIINAVFKESAPTLVLYQKEASYLCRIEKIVTEIPQDGYPEYYKMLSKKPTSYIKILSMKECSEDILKTSVVVSTGNYVLDTLYHSSLSFLLAEYRCLQKNSKEYDETELLKPNDCRYRKSGRCSYRSCINYEYECDRPSACAKQKR